MPPGARPGLRAARAPRPGPVAGERRREQRSRHEQPRRGAAGARRAGGADDLRDGRRRLHDGAGQPAARRLRAVAVARPRTADPVPAHRLGRHDAADQRLQSALRTAAPASPSTSPCSGCARPSGRCARSCASRTSSTSAAARCATCSRSGAPTSSTRCWSRRGNAGTVLAGLSAGAMCWFQWGRHALERPARGARGPRPARGLADRARRRRARAAAGVARAPCATARMPGGWALDDGVGLLFRGRRLERVVSSRPGAEALARRRDRRRARAPPDRARAARQPRERSARRLRRGRRGAAPRAPAAARDRRPQKLSIAAPRAGKVLHMAAPPSGEQFEIVHGEQRASIVEVGGGIRSYAHGGRDVLEPYSLEKMCDGAHGAVLMPWPNRLGDGSYGFDGEQPPARPDRAGQAERDPRPAAVGELARRSSGTTSGCVVATRIHPRPGLPLRPRGIGRVRARRGGAHGHPARPQRRRGRVPVRRGPAPLPLPRRRHASTPARWSCRPRW